ncbi:hypothetical protein BV22DRAFT_231274 [Leucogyrophana mollusca]|uniref:Uncharacterized protein n=1 Tax=Leucogyrophana mollusca TaxID=85980 RepID=A0ACB8BU23_9AGAM|nr:hypothetical protein BV22DRAFT_231274 [Leucogyrophana mollusca]
MGSLAATCIGLDFWHVSGATCSGPTPPGIHLFSLKLHVRSTQKLRVANTLLSIMVCAFECIGTALTTFRCLQALRIQKKTRRYDNSIMYFMLKEGTLYFCGVFVFTFTAVVLNFEEPNGFLGRLLNALTLPVSGLLSARLLLHLREWTDRTRVSLSRGETHSPHNEEVQTYQNNILQSFHAATVGRLSDTDEFGGDPVEGARSTLDSDVPDVESSLPRSDAEGAENGSVGVRQDGGSWIELRGKERATVFTTT